MRALAEHGKQVLVVAPTEQRQLELEERVLAAVDIHRHDSAGSSSR